MQIVQVVGPYFNALVKLYGQDVHNSQVQVCVIRRESKISQGYFWVRWQVTRQREVILHIIDERRKVNCPLKAVKAIWCIWMSNYLIFHKWEKTKVWNFNNLNDKEKSYYVNISFKNVTKPVVNVNRPKNSNGIDLTPRKNIHR